MGRYPVPLDELRITCYKKRDSKWMISHTHIHTHTCTFIKHLKKKKSCIGEILRFSILPRNMISKVDTKLRGKWYALLWECPS